MSIEAEISSSLASRIAELQPYLDRYGQRKNLFYAVLEAKGT